MSEQVLNTISFAGRAAASNQFKTLYTEGMTLVEETASYLDGAGRTASKVLPRMASVLYAAESMRLTTRLMQMASWLLLQRAVNNGEMTRDQVLSEKSKVRLDSFNVDRNAPGWNDLPESFRDLIERSLRLQSLLHLISSEILPNIIRPVLADLGVRFVFIVLLLSGLSFLGLGLQPPNADWGALVRENIGGLPFAAPAVIFPSLAIASLTISVNLLIDNLPQKIRDRSE